MENEETWDPSIMMLKIGDIQTKWRKFKAQQMEGTDLNVSNKIQKSKNLESDVGSPDNDKEND